MYGRGGPDHGDFDETTWREYLAEVQAAADKFGVAEA
jgi:hypothetical protein